MGAFDKYVEILCNFREFFQRFDSIRKLVGAFLTNFDNNTEILCYCLKTPEIREISQNSGAGDTPGSDIIMCLVVDMLYSLFFSADGAG